ncbi:hypothetical protein BELL_0615g00050 [Botrytis elliptica]|uniref:Uncharacterized protein n=1 Tax=Botrytis elliptica TaxID=278938 RepID=A0A4Z1JQF7_9HELO|nr:hypothetical protein EAE99_008666 [Botrytis elliptica]TGO71137.1 hypothetical protein BELL_0615g00050 [Botrytis elliptica]
MPDSTSNRKENTPLELVPKRIRKDSHQEPTPPFKKHKRSESPTSTEPSAGSSPGSISGSAPDEQDVTISSLVKRPLRKDEVVAEISSKSPINKVVTITSPLKIGPSSQIHAGISETQRILVTKENTPAAPLSPQSSSDISSPLSPGPSNSLLPPPSPRPKNLTLPPPSPRPKNLRLAPITPRPSNNMFPPLPPRPRNTMPPPPLPTNAKVPRGRKTDRDEKSMSSPASASPSSSLTPNSKPVRLRLRLINGKSKNWSSNQDPAEDEGIDVTHDNYGSEKSDNIEKVDREEGLVEVTSISKSSTSTAPPLTSSPMIRSSQINQRIMPNPSRADSIPTEAIEMVRESSQSLSPEIDGIPFPNPPAPPYAITYRGLDLKTQIEAHKCQLCIPYGWKIPHPRREDPIIMGPLYRKVIHLRRDSGETVSTAIEFTDAPGEDNLHAFLDRAENDARNAGMPRNLKPTMLAVRWGNGMQLGKLNYRSIYSFYCDPFIFVVGNSFAWRAAIKQMRRRILLGQNWILWWAEKDYVEDWETDLSR